MLGTALAARRFWPLQTAPVLPSCKDNNSEPARHGFSIPPAWGQQVLQGDYWVQILGPCIGKPASKSVTGEFRGTGVADVLLHAAKNRANRAKGEKPSALLNQPPLHGPSGVGPEA